MKTDEIIDKLQLALELCGDGGPTPFTTEEYKEMHDFLEAQRTPEHGCHQWCRGKEPRWKVGDILAYYECYSDYEGEQILGEIIRVEISENDDWVYVFRDDEDEDGEYGCSEESLVNDECYKITKEYYDKRGKTTYN